MSTKKASDDYDTYRLNGDTYRRRKCRFYTDDFKARIVELYNAGKPPSELLREYQLTSSVLYKWIRQYKTSGLVFAAKAHSVPLNKDTSLKPVPGRVGFEDNFVILRPLST